MAKFIDKFKGPKRKIAYYEAKCDIKLPKIHSWVVKLVSYLKESVQPQLDSRGLQGPKIAQIGPQGGPKHKISYYEAKWDLKVPKVLSCVVKLVCDIKESARSIFSTTVRL